MFDTTLIEGQARLHLLDARRDLPGVRLPGLERQQSLILGFGGEVGS